MNAVGSTGGSEGSCSPTPHLRRRPRAPAGVVVILAAAVCALAADRARVRGRLRVRGRASRPAPIRCRRSTPHPARCRAAGLRRPAERPRSDEDGGADAGDPGHQRRGRAGSPDRPRRVEARVPRRRHDRLPPHVGQRPSRAAEPVGNARADMDGRATPRSPADQHLLSSGRGEHRDAVRSGAGADSGASRIGSCEARTSTALPLNVGPMLRLSEGRGQNPATLGRWCALKAASGQPVRVRSG